mmetsp:Transcript_88926/g.194868  ORF Transcript_88926/g.194868 Transcript_88926/m.194868 type:complete len:391 (-) Transcript_88926:293-1465(-)
MGNSSSSSNASLSIALEKVQFRAGEAVRGYVQVHVTAPISCTNVYAKLEGEVRTKVVYTTSHTTRDSRGHSHTRSTRHTAHQRSSIVTENLCVATFPGEAAPGLYQFPFQFVLHPSLPSSTNLPDSFGDSACLAYSVAVVLERPGFTTSNLVSRAMLEVNEAIPRAITPARATDVKIVNLACCIPRGDMQLTGSLSHNAFCGNEAVLLQVELDNRSSEDIDCIAIELKEYISFRANSHSSSRQNILAATRLPGLAAGSKMPNTSVSLTLPPSFANSTLRTQLLTISHVVEVRADTPCCKSNPALQLPVTLYRAPEVAAFVVPPQLHQGEEISYAQPVPYHPNSNAMGSPILVQASVVNPAPPTMLEASAPPQQVFNATVMQASPMTTPFV